MPEESISDSATPNPEPPDCEPQPPEKPKDQEEDVGEFINRHVFEKDSVFFEG